MPASARRIRHHTRGRRLSQFEGLGGLRSAVTTAAAKVLSQSQLTGVRRERDGRKVSPGSFFAPVFEADFSRPDWWGVKPPSARKCRSQLEPVSWSNGGTRWKPLRLCMQFKSFCSLLLSVRAYNILPPLPPVDAGDTSAGTLDIVDIVVKHDYKIGFGTCAFSSSQIVFVEMVSCTASSNHCASRPFLYQILDIAHSHVEGGPIRIDKNYKEREILVPNIKNIVHKWPSEIRKDFRVSLALPAVLCECDTDK